MKNVRLTKIHYTMTVTHAILRHSLVNKTDMKMIVVTFCCAQGLTSTFEMKKRLCSNLFAVTLSVFTKNNYTPLSQTSIATVKFRLMKCQAIFFFIIHLKEQNRKLI